MVLVAFMAGCAPVPSIVESTPVVGECHQLDRPEYFAILSDTAPAVGCTTAHTTETFMVGDLSSSPRLAQAYPAVDERIDIAEMACPGSVVRAYLSANARQALYGVSTLAFLPTPQEWEAGARWVRCDLTVVQGETSAFEPLVIDFSLRDAATTQHADVLMRCFAPGDADSVAALVDVRCTDAHDSRDVNMWIALSQKPSELTIAQLCAPSVAEWAAMGSAPVEGVSGIVHTETNGNLTLRCVSLEQHVVG